MAYRLLAQDQIISVTDGGTFTGSGPNYVGGAGPIPVNAFAKSIKITNKINTADMRGCGDTRKKLRPIYGESQLVVELLTEDSGLVAVTDGGYGKISWTPVTGGDAEVYEGLWIGDDTDSSMDNPQMQILTLDCDADNV